MNEKPNNKNNIIDKLKDRFKATGEILGRLAIARPESLGQKRNPLLNSESYPDQSQAQRVIRAFEGLQATRQQLDPKHVEGHGYRSGGLHHKINYFSLRSEAASVGGNILPLRGMEDFPLKGRKAREINLSLDASHDPQSNEGVVWFRMDVASVTQKEATSTAANTRFTDDFNFLLDKEGSVTLMQAHRTERDTTGFKSRIDLTEDSRLDGSEVLDRMLDYLEEHILPPASEQSQ